MTGTLGDVIKSARAVGTGALISPKAARELVARITVGLLGVSRHLYYGLGIPVCEYMGGSEPGAERIHRDLRVPALEEISLALTVTMDPKAAATGTNYSQVLFSEIAAYLAPDHPAVLPS